MAGDEWPITIDVRVRNLEDEQATQRVRVHGLGNDMARLEARREEHENVPEEVTKLRIRVEALESRMMTAAALIVVALPLLTELVRRLLRAG